MGSSLSFKAPPSHPAKRYLLSFPEEQSPQEASRAPEDVQDWYDHFFETLFCLPHRDGKSILIVEPPDDFELDSRARPGWAHKRLRGAYELLGEGHPRIVRYVVVSAQLDTLHLTKPAISGRWNATSVSSSRRTSLGPLTGPHFQH